MKCFIQKDRRMYSKAVSNKKGQLKNYNPHLNLLGKTNKTYNRYSGAYFEMQQHQCHSTTVLL